MPKPIRDFLEGLVAAAVGGASTAVLAVNLNDASTRAVVSAAAFGAAAALIAYARRKLVDTFPTN